MEREAEQGSIRRARRALLNGKLLETQIEQTTRSGIERDTQKKARTAQRRAKSNPENTKERLAHWIQPYARGAEHAGKRKMIQRPRARNMNKMRKITSETVIDHMCN